MSEPLKLMALDADDLTVISTYVQDAVLKSSEIKYNSAGKQITLGMNRFAWEVKSSRRWFFKKHERRLSALTFNRVLRVRSKGIEINNSEQTLSLLTIEFTQDQADSPAGSIKMIFGGDAVLELDVECIEVQLTDLGAAWSAAHKPRHTV